MNSPTFQVDIVASRDLVRGFQRRLRTIIPVPANRLAIDVLDMPADAVDGGQLSPQQSNNNNKEQQLSPQQQTDEFGRSLSPSSYTLLRRPKSNNKPRACPSLHDSLVSAIAAGENGGNSSRRASLLSQHLAMSSSSASAASASSAADRKEQAAQRLKQAYRSHASELRTKFHPSPDVIKAQTRQIPLILERDCMSLCRHKATTRCFYSMPEHVRNAFRIADEFAYDDCDVKLRDERDAAAAAAFLATTLQQKRHPEQQQQQQQQRQQRPFGAVLSSSGEVTPEPNITPQASGRDLKQRNHPQSSHKKSSPPPRTICIERRVPVPIDERPAWTFVSATDEAATEQLRRRQLAVTPPKPHSMPLPREEKRPHQSPAITDGWFQVCYAVE